MHLVPSLLLATTRSRFPSARSDTQRSFPKSAIPWTINQGRPSQRLLLNAGVAVVAMQDRDCDCIPPITCQPGKNGRRREGWEMHALICEPKMLHPDLHGRCLDTDTNANAAMLQQLFENTQWLVNGESTGTEYLGPDILQCARRCDPTILLTSTDLLNIQSSDSNSR